VKAVQDQAATLMFYSNVVYSPVRARAARLLAEMAPAELGHVYFCNSGTEANETALKLARTWTGKPGVLAMVEGFHGRTLGSLAVTWNPKYRSPYAGLIQEATFLPFGDLTAVEEALGARDDVGAIILEPIQSMAGVVEAEPDYYQGLRDLCDRNGVALIFDEVQTGVGRTGTFSISEQYGITPDLISLAKSLGSGIPVGAVLARDAISETVKPGDQGSTFGGGMVAMAAMAATLETIQDEALMGRATGIFRRIRDGLSGSVSAVRGRGCLIGLELDGPAAPVIRELREAGILVGSAVQSNVIRLMPPLNTTDEALETFVDTFVRTVTNSPTLA
jgi:acetylornithine/succinyldiaminopimelate/putrescine aminotransferase